MTGGAVVKPKYKFLMAIVLAALLLPSESAWAQPQKLPEAPQPQFNAPSAPTAQPEAPSKSAPPEQKAPATAPQPPATPAAEPTSEGQAPPPPGQRITTLKPGQAPSGEPSSREQLFKLVTNVNFVQVPVTVKDESGRLMNGLLSQNFALLENGVRQNITFFTSDPFPISAAVIIDIDLPNVVLDRIKQTFSALTGAFSEYDEMAVYIYGNTVQKKQDFLAALGDKTAALLRSLRKIDGMPAGPAIADSPMTAGPSVNSRPVPDTGQPIRTLQNRAYTESAVLNDAIAAGAADLARRDPTRRRVLFVISDGRESGSTNSYADVLRVLLTNNVTLFAVGVDTAALPIYDKLSRIRLPRQGYGNILPKYASATGGEVLAQLSRAAIEEAYSRLAEEARNQYTIGYYSNAPRNAMGYRSIDVRVNRPDLKVYARDGYYPAPPPSQ
jgi:VWFA-related protein